jgi:hypothetical protein
MKILYRTAFALGNSQDPMKDIHTLADLAWAWIFIPGGRPRNGLTRPTNMPSGAATFAATDLGNGWKAEARYLKQANDRRTWGLRAVHPDQQDAGIEWRTEVVIDALPAGIRFTCQVSVVRRDASSQVIQRKSGQPRIVADVVARFGAKDLRSGIALPGEFLRESEASLEKFVQFLEHPQRQQSVVLISRRPDGSTAVDPLLWAKKLSTLAYVCVPDDPRYTWALERVLSHELICWNGSIRIYHPGFTRKADRYDHPLLTPDSIDKSLLVRGQVGLAEEIQSQVTEALSHRSYSDALFWTEFKELIMEHELSQLKRGSDDAELAKLYAEENAQLRAELKDERAEVGRLQNELNAQTQWRRMAMAALGRIRRDGNIQEALRHLPEVSTVEEALQRAVEEYPQRLVLCLNSKSDPTTPFNRPTDVLNALRWLATKFYESKTKGISIGSPEASLCQTLPNWSYAGNQTETTIGRFEEWYKVDYPLPGGEKAFAEQHMKFGVGADPINMIRIGFLWDDSKNLWVIGYVGPHQRNTKS